MLMRRFRYLGVCLLCLLPPQGRAEMDMAAVRLKMVRSQMEARGIADPRVLKAFLKVPRELFVRGAWKSRAYADAPLPIGEGQTISQPYVVALMTEALKLKPGEKVLEIGTGSGYQAAILREMTPSVYSIEIRPKLSQFAAANLKRAGYADIRLKTGDGFFGWKEQAPFDAILITASANHVPPPLKKQLKVGGRLVLPLGSTIYYQTLYLITRVSKNRFTQKALGDVRFVPMTGKILKNAKE